MATYCGQFELADPNGIMHDVTPEEVLMSRTWCRHFPPGSPHHQRCSRSRWPRTLRSPARNKRQCKFIVLGCEAGAAKQCIPAARRLSSTGGRALGDNRPPRIRRILARMRARMHCCLDGVITSISTSPASKTRRLPRCHCRSAPCSTSRFHHPTCQKEKAIMPHRKLDAQRNQANRQAGENDARG